MRQCEQASNGTGCVDVGVCSWEPVAHSLQETLLSGVKGMATCARRRMGPCRAGGRFEFDVASAPCVKGIRIGPAPPALLTPKVVKILQCKFEQRLTGDQTVVDPETAMS